MEQPDYLFDWVCTTAENEKKNQIGKHNDSLMISLYCKWQDIFSKKTMLQTKKIRKPWFIPQGQKKIAVSMMYM